ncbi:Sapep family Mn(2+)-dependent dipeptidase [Bacillus sp. FJAT-50079]|uniref:Sapep family Mn(2+)-dependent dipeptidase n=1 Tax=Bacillus sp. FJAT-50079 TaxID=2833577 RepID=UPI001BC9C4E7|nr:Sapep family Mn(2+)-dependent dipeptidase [Bacillus sp. FJAT-50079]MBS4208764.1 Sapep family Mn(2+)-dependent dipeptidase [Bacillus sp. FJAT-50079]
MINYIPLYQEKLKEYENQLIDDIADLTAIKSVADHKTKTINAPFGLGVRKAFDQMITMARRDQFEFEDVDGYALQIDLGKGEKLVGILGHLDIVEEGDLAEWDSTPYQLRIEDGFLYGRGVNDDKAPSLAAYYAIKILRDLNIPVQSKIRLILGGAEETTWECMDHYFKKKPEPKYSFSPDGNFPIVNGEKGVVQGTFSLNRMNGEEANLHSIIELQSAKQFGFVCNEITVKFKSKRPSELLEFLKESAGINVEDSVITATYKSDKVLSRNPHKGDNAIFKLGRDLITFQNHLDLMGKSFVSFLEQYLLDDAYGEKIGLNYIDPDMGESTIALTYCLLNNRNFEFGFDYRYTQKIKATTAFNLLSSSFAIEQNFQISDHFLKDLHFVNEEEPFIQRLKTAYYNVMGDEPECITKGGISYARAINNCVIFGPTFPNEITNTHLANERIRIETLYTSVIIYCEAIRLLANLD